MPATPAARLAGPLKRAGLRRDLAPTDIPGSAARRCLTTNSESDGIRRLGVRRDKGRDSEGFGVPIPLEQARSAVRAWVVVIVVLWAAAYLPALSARDLRGEEGRRAIPAREMLQSGDFILPTLFGDPYLNKPPLHFWIIGAVGAMRGG